MLFDKTIYKTKTALKLKTRIKDKHTILAFDYETITPQQYKKAPNTHKTAVIEIEQYDESLWADYPNIAPDSQLKAYKKQAQD